MFEVGLATLTLGGLSAALGWAVDKLIIDNGGALGSAASGVVGAWADRGFSTLSQELKDRIIGRAGVPRNHEVERSVRIAQLQALDLVLTRYEAERKEAEQLPPHVQSDVDTDAGHAAQEFISRMRIFLRDSFQRRLTVKLDRETFERVLPVLDQALAEVGVRTQTLDERLVAAAEAAVVEETKARTGVDVLPPGFERLLLGREPSAISWYVAFRAFLAEQIKSNAQFRTVLLASQTADTRALLEQLSVQLTDCARRHSGELGKSLAAIEAQIAKVANKTSAIGLGVNRLEAQIGALLECASDPRALEDHLDRVLLRGYEQMGAASRELLTEITQSVGDRYFGRVDDLRHLDRVIQEQENGLHILTAPAGLGKSTLLAAWSAGLDGTGPFVARHFFSSRYSATVDVHTCLRSLVGQLQAWRGLEKVQLPLAPNSHDLRDLLHDLLSRDAGDESLVLILDGLDEASTTIEPFIGKTLGSGIHIVVSCRVTGNERPEPLRAWLNLQGTATYPVTESVLPPLDREDLRDWLRHELPDLCLLNEDREIDRLINASEGIPLFLSFLIPDEANRLRTRSDAAGVPPPASFIQYASKRLEELKRVGGPDDVGRSSWGQAIRDVFALVTQTREPIPQLEIEAIVDMGDCDLGASSHSIQRWFSVTHTAGEDLLFAFAHPRLAEVFGKVLGKHTVTAVRGRLIEYLEKAWRGSRSAEPSSYALRWLPTHLLEAGDVKEAAAILCDAEFVARRLRLDEATGLVARTVSELAEARRLGGELEPQTSDWATFWTFAEDPIAFVARLGRVGETEPADLFAQLAHDFAPDGAVHAAGKALHIAGIAHGPMLLSNRRAPLAGPLRRRHRMHGNGVSGALDLGAEGVVTWAEDGSVCFWERAGAIRGAGVIKAHGAGVEGALDLGVDGVVTWGFDGSICFWECGGAIRGAGAVKAHGGWAKGGLHLGADGVVTWASDGSVCFWACTGAIRGPGAIKAHGGGVEGALDLGADGVVTWASDGSVCFWERAGAISGAGVVKAHEGAVLGALDLGADAVVTWASDGSVCFWKRAGAISGAGAVKAHEGAVLGALDLGADGVVTWADDGSVCFWERAGVIRAAGALKAHGAGVEGALNLGPDGVVTWASDSVCFWERAGAIRGAGAVKAHEDGVRGALDLGADGVVTWADDGSVCFWERAGRIRSAGAVKAHGAGVEGAIDLGPDGVVTWASDSVCFWERAGAVRDTGAVGAHEGGVRGALDLGGDGVVTWAEDGSVCFWGRTGEVRRAGAVKAHGDVVEGALDLGADGVVTWASDGSVCFWEPAGAVRDPGAANAIGDVVEGALDLGADGVVTWASDGSVCFWERAGAVRDAGIVKAHGGGVKGALDLGADVVTWASDGSVCFWARAGAIKGARAVKAHGGGVEGALDLEADGVVTWASDGSVCFWERAGAIRGAGAVKAHEDRVRGALDLGAYGVVTWARDGSVCFWERAGAIRGAGSVKAHEDGVRGAFDLGANGVVTWARDGSVCFWERAGAIRVSDPAKAHGGGVEGALDLGADGVVTWASDGSVCFWDRAGAVRGAGAVKAHGRGVHGALDLGPDGVVTWASDGSVRFWERAGAIRGASAVEAHEGAVRGALDLGADGVVTWASEGSVCFWERDGTVRGAGAVKAHGRGVRGALDLGADGMVTWGGDGSVRFWERAGTIRGWGAVKAHRDWVWGALDLGVYGVVTWSLDGSVCFWDKIGTPTAMLCTFEALHSIASQSNQPLRNLMFISRERPLFYASQEYVLEQSYCSSN